MSEIEEVILGINFVSLDGVISALASIRSKRDVVECKAKQVLDHFIMLVDLFVVYLLVEDCCLLKLLAQQNFLF